MGGDNSVFKKPLGKAGGNNSFVNTVANTYGGIFTGGTLLKGIQSGVRTAGEGLGEITGSNALRKQAMDQQQAAEEQARQQANVSDAMARNAGGDPTNIFLATGKRNKRTGTGGTGSSGTGSSRDTGVQS